MQQQYSQQQCPPGFQKKLIAPPGFAVSMAPPCLQTDPLESIDSSKRENRGSPEKPIRNLSKAFEALYSDDTTVTSAKEQSSMVSPTCVTELNQAQPMGTPEPISTDDAAPVFQIHPDLQRELTEHQLQRVSIYSLVHDINKEAAAMYAQDPLYTDKSPSSPEESRGVDSPLVQVMMGTAVSEEKDDKDPNSHVASNTIAIIDEEQWLLSAISQRPAEEVAKTCVSQCPPTFLQAMGEREYENPINAVTGHARTQLWKPSRSWWEAKSGKNPWIEPGSHNKRWRYLWPLIHYHKFLAKCIKKLKRNGVDVKQSVSPVAVFLREEVCAISDHLAAVSMFGSEEWMACLVHFTGWIIISEEVEDQYRELVSKLPLRSIEEPGDIQSPLLRSQIDEHFLRAIVAHREQIRESSFAPDKQKDGTEGTIDQTAQESEMPPPHPRGSNSSIPKQINGVRRPRYYAWWNGTKWEQTQSGTFVDNSSVHSGLSSDSFAHNSHPHHMYSMYPMYPYAYPHADTHGSDSQWSAGMDPNAMMTYPPQPPMEGYYPAYAPGYYHPHLLASTPLAEEPPLSPNESESGSLISPEEAPQYASPYWAHLDHATLSMGLATPSKASPSTPRRKNEVGDSRSIPVQGPLIRQHYYGYATYAPPDAYGPPSPATQFMMTPQASFAYKYGYGTPHRPRSTPRRKGKANSSPVVASSATSSPENVKTGSKRNTVTVPN